MSAPWVNLPTAPLQVGEPVKLIPMRYDNFVAALFKYQTPRMMQMHAALGLCEESGELAGCIKKHAVYGKSLDSEMKEDGLTLKQHIIEEAGDVLFYLQACLNQFGLEFQDVLQYNALKLSKRYAELNYTDAAANIRADKPALPERE